MEMTLRRLPVAILAVLAAVAATAVVLPARARANTYDVYGCRTPSGAPAPGDGWSGSISPAGGYYVYARNSCAEGGALTAALGNQVVHTANVDKATWTFAAPAGTTIAAATLYRAGDTVGGGNAAFSYEFWLAGPGESNFFDACVASLACSQQGNTAQPMSAENRVTVSASDLGDRLYSSSACAGFTGTECPVTASDNGYAAAVYIYASDITLSQEQAPTVSDTGGELAVDPTIAGVAHLTFTASDPASGVYEALVSVDGQLVESPVLDENGGRCRQAGAASDGRPAFLYVQPCPSSLSADVPLDTTTLTDGPHHLVVSVIDAAGNSAPVLDREVTVANPPPPCTPGAAASASSSPQASLSAGWRARRGTRLLSGFGRAQTVVGRLFGPAGAPLVSATIDVVQTPAYEGASPQVSTLQTNTSGGFSLRLPAGTSSRTVCLAYRPSGGGQPVTRLLELSVRAGVSLSVTPHVTAVGQQIFFHGRLLAGPVPPAGKQLVLEARSPGGHWLQFRLVRTGPRGRFGASYRFRFVGPAHYQFRTVSEPESDYPFAAGASNVVGVYER